MGAEMGDDLESPVGLGASLHVRVAVVESKLTTIEKDVGDVKGDIRSIRDSQSKTFVAVVVQIIMALAASLFAVIWYLLTHGGHA